MVAIARRAIRLLVNRTLVLVAVPTYTTEGRLSAYRVHTSLTDDASADLVFAIANDMEQCDEALEQALDILDNETEAEQ